MSGLLGFAAGVVAQTWMDYPLLKWMILTMFFIPSLYFLYLGVTSDRVAFWLHFKPMISFLVFCLVGTALGGIIWVISHQHPISEKNEKAFDGIEQDRRRVLISQLVKEYGADKQPVPPEYINRRLQELGETWMYNPASAKMKWAPPITHMTPVPAPREVVTSVRFKPMIWNHAMPYPEGETIAGILWQNDFIELMLDIVNDAESLSDVDLRVTFEPTNVVVIHSGQLTHFDGVQLFPADGIDEEAPPPVRFLTIESEPTVIRTDFIQPHRAYRIYCAKLPSQSTCTVVFAMQSESPTKIFPKKIKLKGTCERSGQVLAINVTEHVITN